MQGGRGVTKTKIQADMKNVLFILGALIMPAISPLCCSVGSMPWVKIPGRNLEQAGNDPGA